MKSDQHLEQLFQLSVALGTTLDLVHETAAFMAWLREAVEPGLAALFVADEAKRELRLLGAHGFEPPAEPRLPLGLDPWRWLAQRGVSVPEEGDPRRYAVPIPIEQQLFGTLCLVTRRPAGQLAEEQRLVQTAAGYLAPVLRNIHRYQTLEQRVAERTAALSALNTVAATVSQSLDLRETLARALDATLEATGFEVGVIALWDEKEQRLQHTITRGVEPELIAVFVSPPRAGGNRERLLRTGQPVFHDDTAHDPTVNPEIARLGFTTSGMVPLVHQGRILGLLAVATRAPRRWMEEDKSLLTAVGQQIAVAVANAQLYEETQQSEEKYRSLVNTTNDLVFTVDAEGKILFANPAAKAFTGYEPEETIGHHFSEYVHPDDVPILLASIQQVLSGEPLESIRGIGQAVEYHMTKRDGQIVWIQTRAWPLRDAQGKIVGFSGIAHDITERKRAEEALRQSYTQLQRTLEGTVNVLVSAIELRDPYTAGHQRRVTQLACAIAKEMGLPEEQIEGLRMAGLIHDLGKITIPAEILSKPGQLSELEWGMIKAHSQIGYDILKNTEFPWPVARIVLQHHERVDGSGYPQGLPGEEIMLEARILAVADVVEAMASHRPYRPPRGLDKALEEISQHRGILYDPEVVDACLKLFTEKRFALR